MIFPKEHYLNKLKALSNNEVDIYEERLDIEGLDEEFNIFFIADSHIALCDGRDPELKAYSKERREYFKRDAKGSEKNFSILMDYVRKQNPDLIVFGGDIVDSATYASIEYVKKELDKTDIPYVFCIGNHDFSYQKEYYSEKAYEEYMPRLSAFLEDYDSGYRIVEYDKFNILVADDYNYQFADNIGDAVDKLTADDKPVIVVQHVPYALIYDSSTLMERTNAVWTPQPDGRPSVLIGNLAIPPDKESASLVSFVFNNPNVKMVLAGHLHFFSRDPVDAKTIQIITQPAFERGAIKLTLY